MDQRYGKVYADDNGNTYAVMGTSVYRARSVTPDKTGWRSIPGLPPRTTPEAAQADLDAMAKVKGWQEQP